jgi:predicted transcriptional regulator
MQMASLNQNELEALRILWEQGASKPAEIQARFSWAIENATLRSVLVNLVEKRYVRRTLQGKAFFYEARASKTTLLPHMMRTLARVFAGGSSHALLAQLVETGDIKPDDLKLLRRAAAGKPPSRAKRKQT